MIHGDNLERIEELVDKGILFQREGKHKEAIICFDKAINIDKEMNEEADSNLLLLKKNSEMKIDRDE
jgi:tetratricopeptide (TPR) repeat protein